MAIKTFFINSTVATYSDEEFAWFQSLMLNEGIIGDPVTGVIGMQVIQNGTPDMSVLVGTGRALIELTKSGRTFKVVVFNDAQVQVTIPANASGINRVDAIIVRVDKDVDPNISKTNVSTIERVAGTGATALSDGAIDTAVGNDGWYRLANVTVTNGDTDIVTGQIANTSTKVAFSNGMAFVAASVSESVGVADASKVVLLNPDGKLHSSLNYAGFGGNGSDGALNISSGVTNIDLGGAEYFERNYTTISITGTASITFSNPHTNGTIIVFKSKGNTTITSSASPCIDARGMGAAGGAPGNPPTGRIGILDENTGGRAGALSAAAGTVLSARNYTTTELLLKMKRQVLITCGAGGGNGQAGAAGGRGGGALYFECAGAWNFTGIINTSGSNGSNGGSGASQTGHGGGGGGSAGMVLVLYNKLTANSGTYTMSGGAGGTGGTGLGTSGSNNGGGGGASLLNSGGVSGSTSGSAGVGGAGGLGAGGGGGSGGHSNGVIGGVGGAGGGNISPIVSLNSIFA